MTSRFINYISLQHPIRKIARVSQTQGTMKYIMSYCTQIKPFNDVEGVERMLKKTKIQKMQTLN